MELLDAVPTFAIVFTGSVRRRYGGALQVMDIMGAGGFALSNFQTERKEFFEIDKEIVTFQNMEECIDKADYYLRHESETERIVARGCQKVRKEFNYEVQLRKLFDMLGVDL